MQIKEGYDLTGKPIKEKEIQNQIREILSYSCMVFRANVGTFKRGNRYVSTGLPKGFPDLFGFRKSDGKFFCIEVKSVVGKRSEAQLEFANKMKDYDILYGVARNVNEALEIVKEK